MINVLLSGANGKMGRVIASLCTQDSEINIVSGLDIIPSSNAGFPVYQNTDEIKENPDVIIDFSHPNALSGLLRYAVANKIPAVIATTGLSKEQIEELKGASKKIPVFFSANMSLGINLLIDLVKRAAKLLEGSFDIEIIEKHHNQKIDAPSGTALAIADAINESLKSPCSYTYDRHSTRKKRESTEIGLHSLRGGTIVGDHEVLFAGTDEIIEIKHSASSKEIFAVGAVRAAKFIFKKPAGLYDMKALVEEIK